jgi:tRNA-splicing ligase RtcB
MGRGTKRRQAERTELRIDGHTLLELGFSEGPAIGAALRLASARQRELPRDSVIEELRRIVAAPRSVAADDYWYSVASLLVEQEEARARVVRLRSTPVPYHRWGSEIDEDTVAQMERALSLPVAVAGALMPDAHLGYGLPIGGVLATEGSVIPYAVGVDIACRMKLSVLDLDPEALERSRDRLAEVLERETLFGAGAEFEKPADHPVMDQDWSVTPVTRRLREKAARQLGSSGSGNHWVSFDLLTLPQPALGLPAGRYLTVLSHSGSRGPGATVAGYYSKLAGELCRGLPDQYRRLAWLEMDSEAGQEYWAAMHLMRDYARANHDVIHRRISEALSSEVLAVVENEHNLAWKERIDGRELYVHRKGATPAGAGVLGIIPGSMATPAFVVRGRGKKESLESASHGAGRAMSRTRARETFDWSEVERVLAEADVTLLSAGLDEAPGAYKDIHRVMREQEDLVEIVARLDPKIVKMAAPDEPSED